MLDLIRRLRLLHIRSFDQLVQHQTARYAREARKHPDPALSAAITLGHAGMLVHDWHYGNDTSSIALTPTRAAITGFAPTDVKDRIDNLLYRAGYYDSIGAIFEPYQNGPDGPGRGRGPVIGHVEDNDANFIAYRMGDQMDAAEIRDLYPVRPSVLRELTRFDPRQENSMWQVTVIDPQWGDSDLFEFISESADTLGRI